MKTNLMITLTLLFLFGCSNHETQMTQQQQETAKKEIGEAVKAITQNLEKMDVEALFQLYSNTPDFVFLTTDGSMMADLQEVKNHHAAWFKSLSSLKVTPIKDNYIFLVGNKVICSWMGKFEMKLGSGEQLKIDKFGITFIFNKIDNLWKVTYQHSSALPPVPDMSNN